MTIPMASVTTPGSPVKSSATPPSGKGIQTNAPEKGGFATALGQSVSGNGKGENEALNALTLTLAALLGGLFPAAMPQAPSQPSPEKLNTAITQIQTALTANPGLLQKVMAEPGLEGWLQKAQSLLQAMAAQPNAETKPGNGLALADPLQAVNLSNPEKAATVGAAQVSEVIMKLLQAVQQEPGSPLLSELVQDLTGLLGGTKTASSPSQADDAAPTADAIDSIEVFPSSPIRLAAAKPFTRIEPVSNPQGQASASSTPVRVAFSVPSAPAPSKSLSKLAALTSLQLPVLHLATDASADASSKADAAPVDFSSLLPFLTSVESGMPQGNGPTNVPEIPTNAGNFVQDMSQFVFKSLKLGENGAVSEAKLSLSPEHLGQVDVKITMQDGQIVAQFMAQTSTGKELLESQLTQLRAALQNMGLQVDRLDVSQSAQLSSNLFQDQRGAQQSFQQQTKQQKGQADEFTIPDSLTAELQTIAELRSLAYGGGFNVTA